MSFVEAVGKCPSAALPSSLVTTAYAERYKVYGRKSYRLENKSIFGAYPIPQTVYRTPFAYASLLGISEALHMNIFHQPLRNRLFDSLVILPGL
jgi:hypothetical protein